MRLCTLLVPLLALLRAAAAPPPCGACRHRWCGAALDCGQCASAAAFACVGGTPRCGATPLPACALAPLPRCAFAPTALGGAAGCFCGAQCVATLGANGSGEALRAARVSNRFGFFVAAAAGGAACGVPLDVSNDVPGVVAGFAAPADCAASEVRGVCNVGDTQPCCGADHCGACRSFDRCLVCADGFAFNATGACVPVAALAPPPPPPPARAPPPAGLPSATPNGCFCAAGDAAGQCVRWLNVGRRDFDGWFYAFGRGGDLTNYAYPGTTGILVGDAGKIVPLCSLDFVAARNDSRVAEFRTESALRERAGCSKVTGFWCVALALARAPT